MATCCKRTESKKFTFSVIMLNFYSFVYLKMVYSDCITVSVDTDTVAKWNVESGKWWLAIKGFNFFPSIYFQVELNWKKNDSLSSIKAFYKVVFIKIDYS
jgi:hypothetical protein